MALRSQYNAIGPGWHQNKTHWIHLLRLLLPEQPGFIFTIVIHLQVSLVSTYHPHWMVQQVMMLMLDQ